MPDFRLTTPIVLIVFNRPETTRRVFSAIAGLKPPKLMIISDGPRENQPGEDEKVYTTRSIIEQVDWPCEILTNYSASNLGCKQRVSSGISWVFEQVEKAIILEDDCLPDPSFFRFCQELLERYQNDFRIGQISGVNFQFGRRYNEESYYFSKYFHVWGWATWRNRWIDNYDVTMAEWPEFRDNAALRNNFSGKKEKDYWTKIFDSVHRGEIDTWDYQWLFSNWRINRLSVIPSVNLISNIGFDKNATHTKGDSELANLTRETMLFPLSHPEKVVPNFAADRFSEKKCFRLPLWKRFRNKMAGLLR